MSERPAYVDEHRRRLPVVPEQAYAAVRSYAARLAGPPGRVARVVTALLGADSPSGFEITAEDPPHQVTLAGADRFSRYEMDLRVEPAEGGAVVTVATWADFPGPTGRAFRTVVVGSRGHALAVRMMLRSIARRARPAARSRTGSA